MGRSGARHFTTSHRVVNRASWSRRQAGRLLWGWLLTALPPPAATSGLGADDTGERRAGRRSTAPGGDRAAVRSRQQHGRRGGGRNGGAMLRLVPGPWRQRGGAWPCLTALCWPAQPGGRRRHKIRRDWGRQLRQPGRRWRPGPRLVVVVDGGGAAGALALAGVTHPVGLVSRRRGEAALSHPPAPQPPGTRGRQPPKGPRQRRLHAWAHRRDTPGETVAVDGAGGHRTPWWGCSPTARGSPPGVPPVAIRSGLVADPAGQRRLAAGCCPELWATPVASWPWVVRRWSVAVPCADARVQLGVETPRPGADRAIAPTPPGRLGRFARGTGLALRWRADGQIPVPVPAWSHTAAPTCADGWALVRPPRWPARYGVHAGAEPEGVQCPRAALELWLTGLPRAA